MTSETPAVRLLLVEDSVTQARFMQQILSDPESPVPFEVAWVETLAGTLAHLETNDVDLVLLDLVLPDSEGIRTFESVHKAQPDVPVIVLSGAGDQATALRAVAEGAQDYLAKGTMSPELLTRSIRYGLERHRNLLEVRRLALWDDLTGVHNRRGFLLFAEQHLALARRSSSPVTVLFVDVDRMKRVNDSFGHQAGDTALADVAAVMRTTFRASDVIGRIGGDEFSAMLLDDGTGPSHTPSPSARFLAAIDAHNATGSRPFDLSCTVGVVTRTPTEGLTVGDLLSEADDDMYERRNLHRLRASQESAGVALPDPKVLYNAG